MKNVFRRVSVRVVRWFVRRLHVVVKAELDLIDSERQKQTMSAFQGFGENCRISNNSSFVFPNFMNLGRNVHIGSDCYFFCQGGILIQDNVHISRRVTVYASDHDFRNDEAIPYGKSRRWNQVVIERNAWIGMNVCILPGVRIGEGAIVGMGSIVSKDVPPGAIVGQPPFREIGKRNMRAYEELKEAGSFGGKDGERFTPSPITSSPNLTFVVTTGRSGSTTIANILNQHPNILARHEPRPQLIKWSTDFAAGRCARDLMTTQLRELFLDVYHRNESLCQVESDQKYFNLIPMLADIFPEAKFIWLQRSGIDVVSSTTGRGWFDDSHSSPAARLPWYYNKFRIEGHETNDITEESWASMSPFSRNCWYWSFVNNTIERDLSDLSVSRWIRVQVETLDQDLQKVEKLLGESLSGLEAIKSNKAWHPVHKIADWTNNERAIFMDLCGPLMRKYYPDRLNSVVSKRKSANRVTDK